MDQRFPLSFRLDFLRSGRFTEFLARRLRLNPYAPLQEESGSASKALVKTLATRGRPERSQELGSRFWNATATICSGMNRKFDLKHLPALKFTSALHRRGPVLANSLQEGSVLPFLVGPLYRDFSTTLAWTPPGFQQGWFTTSPKKESPEVLLTTGAMAIPHPDKVDKGGEDAYFISEDRRTVGIADGVGGWAAHGVDAGKYSRQLMHSAHLAADKSEGDNDPQQLLETAHQKTRELGSSTACILSLQHSNTLRVSNLGDSGLIVVRDGAMLFQSKPQQHGFNFPYQLSHAGSDNPEDAERYDVSVKRDDIIVVGTDGLFDNVFAEDIVGLVSKNAMKGIPPQGMAEELAALAYTQAANATRVSPFAKAAQEAGYLFRGGKKDDITVLVCVLTDGASTIER